VPVELDVVDRVQHRHVSLTGWRWGLACLRRHAGTAAARLIGGAAPLWIGGTDLEDAVKAGRRAVARGRAVTFGYFGAEAEAPRAVAVASSAALESLARIPWPRGERGVAAPYLSIKAPALAFDAELIGALVARAAELGLGSQFDSHSPAEADAVFRVMAAATPRARATPPNADGDWGLGCTLPGRWRRSLDDVVRASAAGWRVRLVKGQWPDPQAPGRDARDGVLQLVDRLAGHRHPVAVATHDAPLAREALRRLQRTGTPCELELLRGLPMQAALRVAGELGAPVRLGVPFGAGWVPYAVLQLKKRPGLVKRALADVTRGRFARAPEL